MARERVAVYIDGFNMYHALHDLKIPKYKWLNLRKLSDLLISRRSQQIVLVRYFSSFANHYAATPDFYKLKRHRMYVEALRAKGVVPHMGNFAKRDWHYSGKGYRSKWRKYEEKQTDVAIGVHLLNDAHNDVFDRALLIGVDTDMVPVFDVMRASLPHKPVISVAPPGRAHHRDLQLAAAGLAAIRSSQLDKALFGRIVVSKGKIVARRPSAYNP